MESRMTSPATLNAIAIDLVGHSGRTAKNILATYRNGTNRAATALGARYEQLVKGLPRPWLNSETRNKLLESQQRLARRVIESVSRITERANDSVNRVAGTTVKGIKAFGKQTDWANDMMVVGAFRKMNLPAAKLSLRIAGRVDDASRRLSQRVSGSPAAKASRTAKAVSRRARRAGRRAS
jgi:hypothetical protein